MLEGLGVGSWRGWERVWERAGGGGRRGGRLATPASRRGRPTRKSPPTPHPPPPTPHRPPPTPHPPPATPPTPPRPSSHVLEGASASSLILIDELGKGTEAAAGAAVGGAIVERLAAAGCIGVFATWVAGLDRGWVRGGG